VRPGLSINISSPLACPRRLLPGWNPDLCLRLLPSLSPTLSDFTSSAAPGLREPEEVEPGVRSVVPHNPHTGRLCQCHVHRLEERKHCDLAGRGCPPLGPLAPLEYFIGLVGSAHLDPGKYSGGSCQNMAWWYMPVIPAFGRLRQEA
jgi:hypothetical protein